MNAKTSVNYYPKFGDKKTTFYKKSENYAVATKEESRNNLVGMIVTAAAILAVAVWGIFCAYSTSSTETVSFPETVLSQEVASADQTVDVSVVDGELL